MKNPFSALLAVIFVFVSVLRSFAPPGADTPPVTSVSVGFFPSLSGNAASLVSLPTAQAEVIDYTTASDSERRYRPGRVSYTGRVILERTRPSNSTWYTWFNDTANGGNQKRTITLTFTGQGVTNIVSYSQCIPAKYEIVAGAPGNNIERLHIVPGRMD